MTGLLRILLVLFVLSGCEIGDSVDPGAATDELPEVRLVDFSCGDSLVTTDLPPRFPIEDSEIAGVWDFLKECGGIAGSCLPAEEGVRTATFVFELSGFYSLCIDDSQLESGTWLYDADPTDRTLYISGTSTLPESVFLVEFDSPDTLWLNPGCCDQFSLQFAARTFD